jgi:hypothetical protein
MASTIPSVNVSEDNWNGAVAYFDENGNPVYVTDIAGGNPNNTIIQGPGVYDQKNTGWAVAGDGDDPSVYINGIGYTYADPSAVAAPAPAPAPTPAPARQMPRMPQMRKMNAMRNFAGTFGTGDEFRYDPYAQNPKSVTPGAAGGKGKIVNSLLGGKLTQPGGGKNPYGGK